MEAHIVDWMSLVVRWIHFIVGVAWIGASFYFNWLENRLEREGAEPGLAGNLWAIHGGGFYQLQKYELAPPELPATLHWFKWEAYTTWLSGITLLALIYYLKADAFLIDPGVAELAPWSATAIGVASLVVSWIVYDQLCKSPLASKPLVLGIVLYLLLVALAFVLAQFFSGRGMYIHVGAAIGTIMVANVAHVIIPSQRALVNAVKEGEAPDPRLGANALLRSRHNNYLTLPVLFVMISNHYPLTYGGSYAWLVLAAIAAIGVLVRHYYNVRHLPGPKAWMLVAAAVATAVVVFVTQPRAVESSAAVTDAEIVTIVQQRCVSCHAAKPTQPGFPTPPAGVVLESVDDLKRESTRVATSLSTRTMPLGNLTGMTDEERNKVLGWIGSAN